MKGICQLLWIRVFTMNICVNHKKTKNKQIKIAVTFLTGYKGVFNVKDKNKKFYFTKLVTDEESLFQITILPGAYETESLNHEIRKIIIDERHFTQED